MAAFILQEKSKLKDKDGKSDYKPYIDILPTSCKDFPIKYTFEELSLLSRTDVTSHISQQKNVFEHDYNEICQRLCDFADHSYD